MKFAMECGRTSLLNDLAAKVSQLDIQHYMTMIRAAGSEHRVDRAFAIFEQLKKRSLLTSQPTTLCWMFVAELAI